MSCSIGKPDWLKHAQNIAERSSVADKTIIKRVFLTKNDCESIVLDRIIKHNAKERYLSGIYKETTHLTYPVAMNTFSRCFCSPFYLSRKLVSCKHCESGYKCKYCTKQISIWNVFSAALMLTMR